MRRLVGELTSDIYAAGIELPGHMTLELAEGAIIEMMPNDRRNYCGISLDGNDDITVRGGKIRGDRDAHDYTGSAHDEGHGICAWTSVDRVLIEDMELNQLTGDGVLIVGRLSLSQLFPGVLVIWDEHRLGQRFGGPSSLRSPHCSDGQRSRCQHALYFTPASSA